MANQTGKSVLVAYKVEATINVAPGTGSGTQLRMYGGGLKLNKAYINSQEIRPDQQTSVGRHGSRSVDGSFNCEMSLGTHDDWYEAVLRTTWATSFAVTNATIAGATLSAITCGTNTVVSDGGSWITAGVRAGDIFRLTNYSTAGNNSINLQVKSVTTNTITTFGSSVMTAGATDTTFTLTVLRKLKAAATPTERTFYVEQYYQNIDQSEVYGGVKLIGMDINGTPDGMAQVTFSALGVSADSLATGSSPYYISPTLTTSLPLVFADATISYNGVDVAVATAFNLSYKTTAKTEPVIGSPTSPDVFANDSQLTGSISFIRTNLNTFDQFTDETQVDIRILLVENESEPKDCIALFIPGVKLSSITTTLGGDGAMIETANFTGGMASATGYDASMLTISTSV